MKDDEGRVLTPSNDKTKDIKSIFSQLDREVSRQIDRSAEEERRKVREKGRKGSRSSSESSSEQRPHRKSPAVQADFSISHPPQSPNPEILRLQRELALANDQKTKLSRQLSEMYKNMERGNEAGEVFLQRGTRLLQNVYFLIENELSHAIRNVELHLENIAAVLRRASQETRLKSEFNFDLIYGNQSSIVASQRDISRLLASTKEDIFYLLKEIAASEKKPFELTLHVQKRMNFVAKGTQTETTKLESPRGTFEGGLRSVSTTALSPAIRSPFTAPRGESDEVLLGRIAELEWQLDRAMRGEHGTDGGTNNLRRMIELEKTNRILICLLYTSPSPRDRQKSRMPSSA
eukprot:TRINITY_DN2893_c0_g2_i6.p1 TRINITY_DN2893_c0_g2~~TRINITY_DN2893_c0_g2_i6.p1  ORF type:complete len:348 (+),score=68.62 TRINITY_DN2893_c0_g2_i6:228-1271(+)